MIDRVAISAVNEFSALPPHVDVPFFLHLKEFLRSFDNLGPRGLPLQMYRGREQGKAVVKMSTAQVQPGAQAAPLKAGEVCRYLGFTNPIRLKLLRFRKRQKNTFVKLKFCGRLNVFN